MADRVNAHYIGEGKDEFGFKCQVLEDPLTKRRYAAYSIEVWEERCRFLSELMKLTERDKDGRTHHAAD